MKHRALSLLILSALTFLIACGNRVSTNNKPGEVQHDTTVTETWWLEKARKMVDRQIKSRGVTNRLVLRTMRETPRHLFVPEELKKNAYMDSPLRIGEGQTISQPYIVGLMTEILQLTGDERVLEIGTGSGYQAAILSKLTAEVFTIEIVKPLANDARERLTRLGYKNITVKWGDGYQGWLKYAPFDRIIVTAAPDKIPQALIEQLKVGGRMVIPVGSIYQELKVITKINDDQIREDTIIPVRFVPMVHPDTPIEERIIK